MKYKAKLTGTKPDQRIGGRGSNWGGTYSTTTASPMAARKGKKVTIK